MEENDIYYFRKLPGLIIHPAWGISYKTMLRNEKSSKGLCYLNQDDLSSFRKDGTTWKEIYNLLHEQLSNFETQID